MARFLSSEWFDEVATCAPQPPTDESGNPEADLVLEQVVRDTSDGEVRYRVVVASGRAYIQPAGASPPDLTITCDWATATAMARGHLSAQTALMDGRLRIKGNLARLTGSTADLVGLDPVPAEVRHQTTY
jgi:putative sterol carrier protein